MIGVVVKKDGTVIDVNIGEDENDPVVGISDLLVHLSADQLKKEAAKVIEGEDLDVTVASMPLKDSEKDTVKASLGESICAPNILSPFSIGCLPITNKAIFLFILVT